MKKTTVQSPRISIVLLGTLILISFLSLGTIAQTTLVETNTPFQLEINDAVQFSHTNTWYMLIDLTSGILQSSDAEILLTDEYGTLDFTPNSNSIFMLTSPSSTEYTFTHSGVDVAVIAPDEYQVTVTSGVAAELRWDLDSSTGLILPGLNVDWIWTYLFEGDFVGFFNALIATTFNSLSVAIGIIVMLFLTVLYIRTGSLLLLTIVWLLIGGFLIAAIPEVSGLAIIFLALGIGGLFWRLLRPSNN